MLNINVDDRLDSTQIQLSGWAGMLPQTRPRGFVPQKYAAENCLPQLLHSARASTPHEEAGCRVILTSPYPVLQQLGPYSAQTHSHHQQQQYSPSHNTQMYQPADSVPQPSHTVRQTFDAAVQATLIQPPPHLIQGVNPQLHSHGQTTGNAYTNAPSSASSSRKPFVAKIGAAGRRIADAVKQVGHHGKGHPASRHSSAGSNKSMVS